MFHYPNLNIPPLDSLQILQVNIYQHEIQTLNATKVAVDMLEDNKKQNNIFIYLWKESKTIVAILFYAVCVW